MQNKDKAALAESGLNMDLERSGTTGFALPISQAAQGAQVTPDMTGNDLWITSESGHTTSDFSAFSPSVLLHSERGDISPNASYTAYLANLPVEAIEDDLNDFFADYGPTAVSIVEGKDGRRKGFAKIEFCSFEGIVKAWKLSGTEFEFMGRKVQFSDTEPIKTSPLLEYSVATSGHFSGTTQKALEARITQLGASIAPRVTFETDILIATEKDYTARTKEVAAALKHNVHIVSIDWLDKTEASDAKADVMEFSLVTRPPSPLQHELLKRVSKRVEPRDFPKDRLDPEERFEASDAGWNDVVEGRPLTPELEPEAMRYRLFLRAKARLQDPGPTRNHI